MAHLELNKWEDSVEELFTLVNNAKKPNEITMAKTMLRLITRLADNEEERRQDEKTGTEKTVHKIWHDNCSE